MSDTPFVGPTYPLSRKIASVQRTVNMMPVPIEPGNERAGWVFKDVPGLVLAEVAIPPIYYTSWPYPMFTDEALNLNNVIPLAGQLWVPPFEELDFPNMAPQSGTLSTTLHSYTVPSETLDFANVEPQSGTLEVVLHTYTPAPETLDFANMKPQSGTLTIVLITYSNWPAEALDFANSVPISGTCA